ncbi:FecCD family ABC transporter permease [Nocardioides lianchengensis]|uniref:Iron complex transport system permease protein n=1 Tax=Nocardioides lianchengensis TaxID=1045774 RepID=A0A1G6J270_9ACTN|nr:iron ABC transporter permease [Nocardioides lianchengensis]NYG12880.1 iron complex transport system permease protein [Nocardioides lianchengensis]SDC12749.1 iron complex transport system permease protein [Nocardioides lianchengensis]
MTVSAPPQAGTATAVPRPPRARVGRATVLFVSLGVALVVASLAAAGSGQLQIPLAQVAGSFFHHFGLDWGPMPTHPRGDATLWSVRFPRVAMAIVVGAALAVAGALMQGIFGNPLAEPSVVGVSSGAAVAAACAIVFSLTFAGDWTLAVCAFVGGLVTTLTVYVLARADGRTEVVTLVLTGIAVNAVAGALLALLMFLGDTQAREQIVFWQLGSLNGSRWQYVGVVAPLAAVGIVISLLCARNLDLLALGERPARHLGVNVERFRVMLIVVVALLTAAAVSFCGIVAFVGLVVPHLIRMVTGPGHRVLLPASMLAGALVLVVADLGARTLVEYADLPIGMLTSLVGGPFFFWLLRRTRRTAGGWA